MKQLIKIMPLAAILLFAACSKKTTSDVVSNPGTVTTPNTPNYTDIVERVNASRCDADNVTGRVSLKITAGKQKVDVGGSVKMKRDDIIQISLQVFGFVEAGRLELTPDYFLILNRMGKQYVKAAYKDIPFFKQNGIDFKTLQALFWNELFVTDKSNAKLVASDFTHNRNGNSIVLTHTNKQQLKLKFVTDYPTSTLRQTAVTAQNGANLLCSYSSWARVGRTDFPDKMALDINVDKTPIKAEFQYSKLRTEQKWEDIRTNVEKKQLKQISLQQAFSQILSLTN